MIQFVRTLLTLLLLTGLVATAVAAPQKTKYSSIDLIAEQATLPAAGGTVTVGFYIEPDATWHAYWVNPGDAGMEPTIAWDLPEGFAAGAFEFPTPHLLPFGELNTYGFEEPILLLSELTVPSGLNPGDRVSIGGAARWVVCDDRVCVPERADVELLLTVGDGAADVETLPRFADARSKLPDPVTWPAQYSIADGKVIFEIAPDAQPASLDDAYLYIESKRLVQYGTQTAGFTRGGVSFVMDAGRAPEPGDATAAVMTFTDEDGEHRAVALELASASAPLAAATATTVIASDGGLSFLQAALFAFLGGIILNLMPCVFPILSMKALSLVNMGQQDQRAARESGTIYTVGILVAFAAIGAVLLAIRSAGEAVGWGFQMQNPLINVGLGLLMVLIAMNLFGAFEIGTRVMGVGQGLTEGGERKSAFFTGLLAVVVATPCTAPFMAGALGYALAQPAALSMSIFLALGLGLAFPYLVLSFVPALGRLMPKPGAWMETFKHLLAFPMLLTAVWLFWVVGKQLGPTSMTVALLAAVALAFALWAYGKGANSPVKGAWYATAVAGLIACGAAFSQVEANRVLPRQAGDVSAGTLGGLTLEQFDPDRVRQYIADGQPTFVYFTADWCISCKANERVALSTDAVAEAFNERSIKVIEGDWTMEDPVITEWLEMYDRAGVPLYLYFPTGSSLETVTILPQILTPGLVVDAIATADANAGVRVADTTAGSAETADEPGDDYRIPVAAPEWQPVDDYIEVDTAWHELQRKIRAETEDPDEREQRYDRELGPHPDIEPAMAAAAAIVRLGGAHEMTTEAAAFLVEHTPGAPGYSEALALGLDALFEHNPGYENWPRVLFETDFYNDPGEDGGIDALFEDFEFLVDGQPLATATARYYAASRQMRLANAVNTPAADRARHRERGIEFATGLSEGVEREELIRRRRFNDDGSPIPFPSMADAEKDLLYNLSFLTVGEPIPDVMGTRLDGIQESISTYQGQAVLLDFWATWCAPCIATLPKMAELDSSIPDDVFEILSISVDEKLETVTRFQERRPMDWANWHVGPRAELLQTWAVRGYPTYILVDHDGVIVARQHDLDDEFMALIRDTACGQNGAVAC